MDEEAMSKLLAPIGDLGAAMANLEVPESVAAQTLAEVLRGAAADEAKEEEERARREERAARAAARGKALEALRHAQLAATLDAQHGDPRTVVKYYERALADFGVALKGRAIPDSGLAKTLAAMAAYLDRCRDLRLGMRADLDRDAPNQNRRAVLLAMARSGYAVLARGVAAREAALAADQDWPRYILFADAADCFVVYLKSLDDATPPPAITKAATDALKNLEALTASLKQHPP